MFCRLLAKRREQLEALKRGFIWAADLRPALQLFGGGKALHTLYCPSQWSSAAQIIEAVQFAGWPRNSTTPKLFLDLLRHWEGNGGANLSQLLLWWTASDRLDKRLNLTVEPVATGTQGYCESATCTRTLRLPECQSVPDLEQRLQQSMLSTSFHRE